MERDPASGARPPGPAPRPPLAGLPAVVTGASRGIGAATARALATGGAPVAVVYHRNGEAAEAVVAAIEADGGRALAVAADVSVADDVDRLFRVVEAEIGPAAILVNNAGIHRGGRVQSLDPADWDAVLATDLTGAFLCARRAVPGMIHRQWGRIVNVSSIYGRTSTPLTGWYQGCKHALEGLTDALRMELARDSIKVVLVEPGGFRTGIWEDTEREVEKRAGSSFDASYSRTLSTARLLQPLMGEPKHCAAVILDVVEGNPRARYLVGIDAQALGLIETFAPTSVKDRITRLTLGL